MTNRRRNPEAIRLTLPLPPSSNNAYGNRKDGRGRFKTEAYKRWLKLADGFLMIAKPKPLSGGAYKLRILLPKQMRGDVSNRIKLCEDFLVSRGITPDDRKSDKTGAERHSDVPGDECWVEIEGIDDGRIRS